MNNEEFNELYDDWLAHRWVTSKDAKKRAEQKKKEQEYNKQYYEAHKKGIAEQIKSKKEAGGYGSSKVSKSYGESIGPTSPKKEGLSSVIYNKRAAQINKNSKNELGMDRSREFVDWQIKVSNREKNDLNKRNSRSSRTAKSQGNSVRDSYRAKEQDFRRKRQAETLRRVSKENTRASEAQASASAKRTAKRRKKRAYESAAKNERSKSNRRKADYRNRKVSQAQDASAKKRSAYAQSLEGKIVRNVNKASKKINDAINSGKAAKKKAREVYNNATEKYSRIKKAVKRAADRINK